MILEQKHYTKDFILVQLLLLLLLLFKFSLEHDVQCKALFEY